MSGYRTELKFLCSEKQLIPLENRISHFCERDAHTNEVGQYRIRSMYFDSADSECYLACKSGVDDRKKYRIRIYNESTDRISLECKKGYHGKKKKDTVLLSGEELEAYGNGAILSKQSAARMSGYKGNSPRFDFETKLISGYRPAVVVGYLRTAYVYPVGDVRITIDREITAMPVESFLEPVMAGIPILPPEKAILEVKYTGVLPKIIKSLLKNESLSVCSYSKYALCRDAFLGMLQYNL